MASSKIATGKGLAKWKLRVKTFAKALQYYRTLAPALNAKPGSVLQQLLDERPETIGALIWSYQCSNWNISTRINRIINHCSIVDELGHPFNFRASQRLVLLELGKTYQSLRIVLDQPQWFLHEGLLVINIFLGEFRLLSLAFSFCTHKDGKISAIIGAIQGRKVDGILEAYKVVAKSMYGLRPRDFLLEVFRVFCKTIRVTKILAVSNDYHYRQHAFFNMGKEEKIFLDYDGIWEDRGASKHCDIFYALPIDANRRSLLAIKSKKRSAYKKRYEFLDGVETCIRKNLSEVEPTWVRYK